MENFPDVLLSKVWINDKELLGLMEGKHFTEREERSRNRGKLWEE